MIYFDNAATSGNLPESVIGAASAAMRAGANPGRSGHALSVACAERIYAVRKQLQSFFNAPSAEKIIFTKNCTEALNIALLGGVPQGGRVVTTVAEHNSVLRPLNHLARTRGVHIDYVPLTPSGNINMEYLAKAAASANVVAITLASNVTGIAPDICAVKRIIPPAALLICDGAQACGHVPADLLSSGIDALAVAGHKGMLAIQGSGALILSERFNPAPMSFGGTGSASLNPDMPDFYPDMLEAGTLNYPAIISLGEAVLYLKPRIYEYGDRLVFLTDMLINGLREMPFVKLYSRTNAFGIVAFELIGTPCEMVAERLSRDYCICVRAGLHCAPLMHRALSSQGLVRASLSPFNTKGEVEYFLKAVSEIGQS